MPDIISIVRQNDNPGAAEIKNSLGQRGEALAADHLVKNGYRIVLTNFKAPVGRNSRGAQITGEIDLIALDGETLCFVEVKTRRSEEFTPIITNVDLRKQRQITRTAKVYRRIFNIRDLPHRFDVVSVYLPKYSETEISLIKGFWTEEKFRKKQWEQPTWDEFR